MRLVFLLDSEDDPVEAVVSGSSVSSCFVFLASTFSALTSCLPDFPFIKLFYFSLAALGLPTPVFLPGESQGRGSLVGCLWGRTESDTTEAT